MYYCKEPSPLVSAFMRMPDGFFAFFEISMPLSENYCLAFSLSSSANGWRTRLPGGFSATVTPLCSIDGFAFFLHPAGKVNFAQRRFGFAGLIQERGGGLTINDEEVSPAFGQPPNRVAYKDQAREWYEWTNRLERVRLAGKEMRVPCGFVRPYGSGGAIG